MWDNTFNLFLDGCIKWKIGKCLPDKTPKSILASLMNLWIRIWRPMGTLMGDQEGAIVSHLGSDVFEKFSIKRVLVGKRWHDDKRSY